MFCPKCSAILLPKKEGKKVDLVCSCGYVASKKKIMIVKEEIKLAKIDEIEVVDKSVETLPKIRQECPKCRHMNAYYWLVQTRAGDEAATRFFKCGKCSYTWREYS